MDAITTKEEFKAIIKLCGLNTPKKFAKVMKMSEESAKQLLYRADRCPRYLALFFFLFRKFLYK